MKLLSLILFAALAFAADEKPKTPPAMTTMSLEDHADLLLSLAGSLSSQLQVMNDAKEKRLGFDVMATSESSQKAYTLKLEDLRAKYNAPASCQWNFVARQWSCPILSASEIKK